MKSSAILLTTSMTVYQGCVVHNIRSIAQDLMEASLGIILEAVLPTSLDILTAVV